MWGSTPWYWFGVGIRSPSASCWPAAGPGATTVLSPNCTDLRTNQALESPGAASVPSGYRHPGLNACGMGSGSVYGWVMNGLAGNGSPPTPQPLKEMLPMSMGALSAHTVWPNAFFVTRPAAP